MAIRAIEDRTISRTALTALGVLAAVFAVGLAFASVELPRMVSGWMMETIEFPGFDSGHQVDEAEAWVQSRGLRIVGYSSLAVVLLAVAIGLVLGRRGLATAGAVALFLPVFGHFAASMFFLAGLGMLRLVFLPVMDRSYSLMALGEVAFVPYMAAVYPPALAGFDARGLVIWGTVTAGMAVFILGVFGWFIARFRGSGVANMWVYGWSRHPQYLGWILWSYGLMLYVSLHSELYHFKISYGVPSSLPWLLSTMVIIGVALSEEIAMKRRFGEAYDSFAERTPFLLPLPRPVGRVLAAPMRLVIGRDWPATGGDVVRVVVVYTALLILLSVPFVVFGWPAPTGWYAFPYNVPPFV